MAQSAVPVGQFSGRTSVERFSPERVLLVSFEAGARTFWHSHEHEQVIIVHSGAGWLQYRGEAKQPLVPGGMARVPAGVVHWHGARARANLEILSLTAGTTSWFEEVDEPE